MDLKAEQPAAKKNYLYQSLNCNIMNNTELLRWGAFKATLQQHANLKLQFQYAEGKIRRCLLSYHRN